MTPPRKLRRTPEDRSLQIGKRMSGGTGQGRVDSASPVRNTVPAKATQRRGSDCHDETFTWFEPGVLGTWTGTDAWYPPFEVKLTSVHIATKDSNPTGSDIVVDINKNIDDGGASIFTNPGNRPRISAGSKEGSSPFINDQLMELGDYLTYDIDQVGSTVPGSNLAVTIGFTVCPSPIIVPGPTPPPTGSYPDVVLADNPLIYYRLEETTGTVVTDYSGHGYDGTYVGSPTLAQSGLITEGTSVYFDGVNDQINVPAFPLNVKSVSVECWAKAVQGSMIWDFGNGTNWFGCMINVGGTLTRVRDNGAGSFNSDNNTLLPTASATDPVHFVVVIDRNVGTITQYYNGVAQTNNPGTGTTTNTANFWASDTGTIATGIHNLNIPGPGPIYGYLDEFALYDYALTPTQIANHYAAGI